MKLTRISLASFSGCLIGLIAMAVVGSAMLSQINAREAEMRALMVLQNRIDNFSAASDRLLNQRADPSLWSALRVEALALQEALAGQEEKYPAAQQAIDHIDGIVAILETVYPRDGAAGDGAPLSLAGNSGNSFRGQILMTRVMEHGIAIESAMREIENQQRAAINGTVYWLIGAFAATTLVFGLCCMLAFTLLYRRIHGPLQSLIQVAAHVEKGKAHVRAESVGSDEFSELAATFNRMLDRQQRDQAQLEERARLLDIAGETALFGGWWVDLRNDHCYWSDMVAEIHGLPHDYSPCVEDGISFYVPEHRPRIRECWSACVESGAPYDEELQIINTRGQRRWVRTIGVPVHDNLGTIERVEGSFQDITLKHEMADKLQHSLKMRYALIDSLPAHIAVIDNDGNIFDTNDQWRLYGTENASRDEQFGLGSNYLLVCQSASGENAEGARESEQGLRELLIGERDSFSMEYPCHSPAREQWFRLMAKRLGSDGAGDRALGAVVMHVDITERKLAERQLEKLAYEDPLTGLLNRLGFTGAVNRQLHDKGWQAQSLLVLMDIKSQSDINDAHGYEIGDSLLNQIGQRLRERLDSNLVGRVNGDSFVFFLQGTDPDKTGEQWLNSLLHQPFRVDDTTIEVSARFGVTFLDEERRSAERLLHEAELALFETRRRGIRDWGHYSSRMDKDIHERIELTGDLQRALAGNQLELHYQPKVNLQNGKLIACEALLRWVHPQRGMLSPAIFIPVAEQSQLIGPIGEWVLFEACRQLRQWQDANVQVVRVAVNVSMVQFELGGLIDQVRHAITTHGIDPGNLTLEITGLRRRWLGW